MKEYFVTKTKTELKPETSNILFLRYGIILLDV